MLRLDRGHTGLQVWIQKRDCGSESHVARRRRGAETIDRAHAIEITADAGYGRVVKIGRGGVRDYRERSGETLTALDLIVIDRTGRRRPANRNRDTRSRRNSQTRRRIE